jgi:hypothetical protein
VPARIALGSQLKFGLDAKFPTGGLKCLFGTHPKGCPRICHVAKYSKIKKVPATLSTFRSIHDDFITSGNDNLINPSQSK